MNPRPLPRGVTLVELLAAISIVVVVSALSLPAVQSRLAGARLEAMQGQIEAAVIATRAEAVRAGRVMELVARWSPRTGETELVVAAVSRVTQEARESGEARTPSGMLWCTLPRGMRIAATPSAVEDGREDAGAESRAGATEDIQIAMFCPDGTAVSRATVYLREGGSDWTIAVNGWVGGASFSRHTPKEDAPEEAPEDKQ